jgi:hypothetical protein
MSEVLTDAASNAALDSPSVSEAVSEVPVSASPREALERAFGNEPEDSGDTRARDEQGRFAPKAQPEAAEAPPEAETAPEAPAPVEVPPPPSRFAKAAQEAWAQAPDVIRAEVARMEAELTKGLNDYQERFAPLKQFDDMARQSGKTLDTVLHQYVGMERQLAADPVAGFALIAQNMGLNPVQWAQTIIDRFNGAPQQPGLPVELAPVVQTVQELKREIEQERQTRAQREFEAHVERFAADKPRFGELADTIVEMIQTGFAKSLEDAYAKAERLNPAPPAPQAPPAITRTADPAQTRKASLSVTGSPGNGSDPMSRKPAGSARDALANAFAQTGL